MKKSIVFIFCLGVSLAWAEGFNPANILLLDKLFSPYALVVEKATHTLYIFQHQEEGFKLQKKIPIASGKLKGNKQVSGDNKTPEGIYFTSHYLTQEALQEQYGAEAKQYGAGAFVLNYPNLFDRKAKKTGHGIWLHSTDDETRIQEGESSQGCVVLTDETLKAVSSYIRLKHTPVVIVEELHYVPQKLYQQKKSDILTLIDRWKKSWQEEKLTDYLAFYHSEFFTQRHPTKSIFSAYKRAVFQNSGNPRIALSHPSILQYKDQAIVRLKQDYQSDRLRDTGEKVLYLKLDKNYQWKILSENWIKIDKSLLSMKTPQT